jgi:hypothetical protein
MCFCSCFCPSSCSTWHSFVICTGPVIGAGGSTCPPLARGQKPPGSTEAGKHRGLRLSYPPVPVLRHHRRSHSCSRWGWHAWPCRAHPNSALPGLPYHVHYPAPYPFVPLENSLSCRVAMVLTALGSWAGSFRSSAGLRLPASHHHHQDGPRWRARADSARALASRNLQFPHLQLDELRTRLRSSTQVLWLAIDPLTKSIPVLYLGPRTQNTAHMVIHSLRQILAASRSSRAMA